MKRRDKPFIKELKLIRMKLRRKELKHLMKILKLSNLEINNHKMLIINIRNSFIRISKVIWNRKIIKKGSMNR